MNSRILADALALTIAACAYAALGERCREMAEQMLAKGDAYRAGYDQGYVEGYDVGYAEGRRVALRPVVLPPMRIGP